VRKYKPVRIPIEAYNGLMNKRSIFETMLKEELKKPKTRFTFADTLRFVSNKKIYVYNDELVNFIKNKKNKKTNGAKLI
jgi:hypothetical protein